jgi:Uma2 family endonuclease
MATVPARSQRRGTPAPEPAPTNGAVNRSWVRIPVSALTLAGFRAWATSADFPEHVRAAFIDQEVYLDMSNEDLFSHVGVKDEISRVLLMLSRALKRGRFFGDGVLITNEAAGVSNNPDASFCLYQSIRSGKVRLVAREGKPEAYREIEGTPDWLVEVLSDSSEEKDTEKLRDAYHRAGVSEYWLIDARGEEIVFQILYWRKKGYVAAPIRDGWQRSRVFGRSFRLERERDELGLWIYTLQVRED